MNGYSSSRDEEANGVGKSAVIFLIVALALILAIGFFYVTRDTADRGESDAMADSIEAGDNVAITVSQAARNTVMDFRPE